MPTSNARTLTILVIAGALYLAWLWLAILPLIPALEYEPANYAAGAERAEARQDNDAKAQVWMAWAAWAQVAVGVLGLVGLGITIYFARNAWLESHEAALQARRSADIAEREHREGNRGHLFATIGQSTIEFTGTEGTIPEVRFWLKNVGQRHVIVRVARYGLIRRSKGEPLAEFPGYMPSSATTLEPKLIEPGEIEAFDGTVYRSGGWLTEENWPGFVDTVYFQIQVFYTGHLEMLREYGVTWRCYSPNDDWDGMFLYERGYDREVQQISRARS